MQLQFPITPDEFTRSEQMILEYIGSHTDEFLFLPIGQISAQLGLSDATLSRFARRVGCRDFKALKSLVMEQSGSHGPAVKLAGTLQEEGGFSLSAWIRQQQLYLEKRWNKLMKPNLIGQLPHSQKHSMSLFMEKMLLLLWLVF